MSDVPLDDWHYDDAAADDEDDDLWVAEMSCGLAANNTCTEAGTEWCDWECPFANEARHNRRPARKSQPDLFTEKDDGHGRG